MGDHGGRVAMLGLPAAPLHIDRAKLVPRMITIKGIYGRQMFETWHAMSPMLHAGLDVSAVITTGFLRRGGPTPSSPRRPAVAARSSWTGLSWTESRRGGPTVSGRED
jgi:threonine 3-dehydrogenase